MIGDTEDLRRIREQLAEHPRGMSITDISQVLGMHRTTVAKYLDGLQMKGEVDLRIVSTAKVYHLANRIPSSAVAVYTHDPYILITCRMVVETVKNNFCEIFGLSDDPTGRQITDPTLNILMQEEMKARVKTAIQGQGGSINLVISVKGIRRWLDLSIIPVVCEDGRPGCAIICRDETKTKEALQQAEICRQEADALSSDQKEFIFRARPDGILTYVNDAFCRRMERKREELIGFPYEPVISHDDLERLTRLRTDLTPKTPITKIAFKTIQADGMVAWEEWQYRGIFTIDGFLGSIQAIGSDISERKHLEEQLQIYHANFEAVIKQRTREMRAANQDLMTEMTRREKLERELLIIRFVFDQASDSILLFDRTGAVYRANETACKLLGYSREEIQQITVYDINPEISAETWQEMWELRRDEEETFRVRSVHRRHDGEIIPVEISRKFITAGPLSLFCSIAREIVAK
ncbi:MAG TPA: PAS domain S-box protein [Methanospirillum sp.]|uniref:PAS domain S-box protein n=1 Tax=Methanospirillum sp. TaxID=45200 RepID=UPI002D0C41F5|nr:PAS domain S-box protein [Methanospirillum sp.]HWQ63943.1 PAS domain S-box protein [Methanospirillum sp.]